MHEGVQNTERDDEPSSEFVQINVLIEWKNCSQSSCSQECQRLTEHQNQNESAVEVETLTYQNGIVIIIESVTVKLTACSRENNEKVALSELDRTADEQKCIKQQESADKDQVN